VKRLAALAIALLFPVFGWAQYNSYIAFAPGAAPSYEGLWWNSSESGWGVSIAHQGDTLFAIWYTYDQDGSPVWMFMPSAQLIGDDMETGMGMMDMEMMGMPRYSPMYSGTLYRSSMSAGKVSHTEVGMATFLFKSRTSGVFAYTVGNVSGSKDITQMLFAGTSSCNVGGSKAVGVDNYQDLWWNAADSGWGVNIAQQGDTIFATYYTYGANGNPEWYVMSDTARSGASTYSGPVLRARGPAFDSAWDVSKVSLTQVGSATFAFDASGHGTFDYLANGQRQVKPIERMAFAAPASVCR
jgi:hypothetical protein